MDGETSFGRWVRQRRKALDLTQDELAHRVGCSEITIRKVEADERRPGKPIVERLADILVIPDEERQAFVDFARGKLLATAPALTSQIPTQLVPPRTAVPANNLPVPATPLVGREQEVGAASTLLRRRDVRLVTLTGPGGTGKTRLAVEIAADLHAELGGRICFVALASLSDSKLVGATIAQTLEVKEDSGRPLVECLKSFLLQQRLLLVLDNFEQVIGAAALVAELLAAAPQLKVLVTSRAVLHISGEHEYAVPPLALPQVNALPALEELVQYPAVTLFVQRAAAVKPDFQLSAAHAPVVVDICRRLDGLPLAIELAAARTKLLPPPTLLARLERRLTLLTAGARDLPARQQTLRSTIDWSYELLQMDEQTLFARLGVFVGGCTLGAAEAICAEVGDSAIAVLDVLQTLLDNSLLRQEAVSSPELHGEPRFTMLETIHEYAVEKALASGEWATLRQQHTLYYLELVEEAETALASADQEVWLLRLDHEHDNLRAALDWCEGDAARAELGLRVAGALWRFWERRGYLSEGRQRLTRLLALAPASAAVGARAKALNAAGRLAWYEGKLEQARAYYEPAVALFRSLGDQQGIAELLNNLGNIAYDQGDYKMARSLHQQSLAIRRAIDDQPGIARSLNNLGNVASDLGDYPLARSLHEQSLAIRRVVGDRSEIPPSLCNLAEVLRWQGEFDRAKTLLQEGLELCQELRHRWGSATMCYNLGQVTLYQGDRKRAKAYFDESLAVFRELEAKQGIALALSGLGRVAVEQADVAAAQSFLSQSLVLFQQLGDKRRIASSLERLAQLALTQGLVERVTRLWGAAAALRELIHVPVAPADRTRYELLIAAARHSLQAPTFEALWAEGERMTAEQAISYALQHDEQAILKAQALGMTNP